MTTLRTLPAWSDNYVHLLSMPLAGSEKDAAVVIDPTDAMLVLKALQEHSLKLQAILLTHHHPDHVQGVDELVQQTGCKVFGHQKDASRLPACEQILPNTQLEVGSFSFKVLDVKAHTLGHIAYLFEENIEHVFRQAHDAPAQKATQLAGHGALFCGDALFIGGCGRLFEGKGADLLASMQTIWNIKQDVLVCCAHEYTDSNLKFCEHILKETSFNHVVSERRTLLTEQGTPSVPNLLSIERTYNPFLLCAQKAALPELQKAVKTESIDATVICTALRAAKDSF